MVIVIRPGVLAALGNDNWQVISEYHVVRILRDHLPIVISQGSQNS